MYLCDGEFNNNNYKPFSVKSYDDKKEITDKGRLNSYLKRRRIMRSLSMIPGSPICGNPVSPELVNASKRFQNKNKGP